MIQGGTPWASHMEQMARMAAERAAFLRAIALYTPIVLCVIAYFLRGTRVRTFAAPLLSVLWALPTLLILQRLNLQYGWWQFDTHTVCVLGMPVALYLG